MLDAVGNVRARSPTALEGFDALDQRVIDLALDRPRRHADKSRLGANAILGVSLAVAKAAADELDLPLYRYLGGVDAHVLPVPMMNVLNGGVHADNNVDFQEFMIVPHRRRLLRRGTALGRRDLPRPEKLCCTTRVSATAVGDEGGFAPNLGSNEEALTVLFDGDRDGGPRPRRRDRHRPRPCRHRVLRRRLLRAGRRGPHARARRARRLLGRDRANGTRSSRSRTAMAEEDWDGWAALTEAVGDRVQLVGDDLFVTNVERARARHRRGRRQRRA